MGRRSERGRIARVRKKERLTRGRARRRRSSPPITGSVQVDRAERARGIILRPLQPLLELPVQDLPLAALLRDGALKELLATGRLALKGLERLVQVRGGTP